ncbi:outer membrane protein assembly factor [Deinococcus cavernae]|uniref:Outer membrane protein assembly factor n=1 Tax=Deinococcus cavernae TaxID=2320857 RepID=A0A418VAY7_9DEIO|nr:outer membrane protein assembly factor [Deinococcus cavernae]RJF73237.1 outer membrane protein assembly factor [Deinococcus cavernae]
MRHSLTLAVTLALAAPAYAQTAPATTPAPVGTASAGTVQDISIVGSTDLLSDLIKSTITVQQGTPLSSVNLRQVEQDVLGTGYFKSAIAELRTVQGRDTLVVTVQTNPTISAVDASGLNYLPADAFKKSISDLLNIAPGATLNTQRIDQAKTALAQNYQQQGFPFVPSISSTLKTNADGTVTVAFVVDETAPISRVEVSGATLLPQATITSIFKPLYDSKKFTTQAFFAATDALQKAYTDAGYIQAGIAPGGVTLDKGVLKIQVTEGVVADIDTSALGEVKSALQTRVGTPVRLATLQADVRALANETGQPVGFALQPDQSNPGRLTVFFGAAEVESGPIKTIQFAGNTQVPTATLAAALKTKVGDVYSPQLAQDDFVALREAYRKAGYEISTRDAVSFKEGVLTFNIREVRVAGYKLAWQGNHKTKDHVILRELPAPGRLFNLNEIQEALGRVSRLGFVTISNTSAKSNDAQNPENITYVIQLADTGSRSPNLMLGYDTVSGWNGSAGYEETNFLGLGQRLGLNVTAGLNQAGQNFSGGLNYTIPWLDLNFGDFKRRRTSASFNLYSTVGGNQTLYDNVTDSAGKVTKEDTGRDYTVRTTGLSVNLGRNITPNLSASVGAQINYKTYYLETIQSGETTTTSNEKAATLLPKENLTTRLESSLAYDSTDNQEFPGAGWRGNALAAYNFGRSGSTPLGWTDAELGASKYFGFGAKRKQEYGSDTYKNVFAARLNYGTSVGSMPEGTGYYVGGVNPAASRELRGLNDGQLFGTSYVTSAVEYRHDFGLNAGFAQGLYGILWADAGGVWKPGGNFEGAYGLGAGVQLNLGIGGTRLPTLRFDYGWSPQRVDGNGNQQGARFMFKIGNFW